MILLSINLRLPRMSLTAASKADYNISLAYEPTNSYFDSV